MVGIAQERLNRHNPQRLAEPEFRGELRAIGYTPSEVFMAMLPAAVVTAAGVFALTTFCRTYRED